ncbi:MAG: efflux RND transporter periplasmic adaptor subunit [Parachlamydiaceae bacterium]
MFLRNFLLALSILGLLATIILYALLHSSGPKVEPVVAPAANPYATAVAAAGIVEASRNNVEIGTPISGIIKRIYVKVWQDVKKNDPLFSLDDRELMGQLYVQEANQAIAEATLNKLEDQLQRLKAVEDPRAVSLDEVKTRENEVLVSKAELAKAKAEVVQTKLLLDRITVKSPKDGTIIQSNFRNGEFVEASSNTPVMILGELNQLQIRVDVDEQNASRIRPNQPAVAFPKNNTKYKIPLRFIRIEPYVIPKKSLTGGSTERVDTRVLQIIYKFPRDQEVQIFVGQQMDVFIDTSGN